MKTISIGNALKRSFADGESAAPEFLSEKQLCHRLGVGVTTLRRWRWEGREIPKNCRLGRLVRYHKAEVDSWIKRVVSGELNAGSRNA